MDSVKVFQIKTGTISKVRLFLHILSNPWAAFQTITMVMEEHGKLEEELCSLRHKLADALFEKDALRQKIFDLKGAEHEKH